MNTPAKAAVIEEEGLNLADAADCLDLYLDKNIPAFLWGAPGIGKSDVVRQIAAQRRIGLIDLRAVLLDPVDLRGVPSIQGRYSVWAQPTFLPREDRDGKEGILFLDELNAAPPSTQAACFQLVLDRRLGEYEMPQGWRIVAAGNRQKDRAAAQRMPSALANRFAHLDVVPDLPAWQEWAIRDGVSILLRAFLRFRPAFFHVMDPGGDLRAFPTPRSWVAASKVIEHRKPAVALRAAAGLVGRSYASEFRAFVEAWSQMPSLDDIIANPSTIAVPTAPNMQYAVSSALANIATRANFDAIMTYTQRLPVEFDILTGIDAMKKTPAITATVGFVNWSARNQHVQI